jgi:hypothetical protein
MAAAVSGRSRAPLYTTGPATRHALAAAGALGATTGTTVHLPSAPVAGRSVPAVLAHELTHTRNPVRRPRFFLGGGSALLDDDERSALAAGKDAMQSAGAGLIGRGRSALTDAAPTAAGIVDSLPVGGGMGAVGEVATRAARAAVMEAAAGPMAAMSGMAGDAASAAPQVAGRAADAAGGLVSDVAEGAGQAAGAIIPAGAAAAVKSALDPDKVVEIVEQRLLREIERRGGRWAGTF